MIEHRSSVGIGVLNGLLYAVGGYNGQTTVNTVERYNPRTEEWTMICEMTTARSMLGVASLNGHLYAVGKYNTGQRQGTNPHAICSALFSGLHVLKCMWRHISSSGAFLLLFCTENSPNTVAK